MKQSLQIFPQNVTLFVFEEMTYISYYDISTGISFLFFSTIVSEKVNLEQEPCAVGLGHFITHLLPTAMEGSVFTGVCLFTGGTAYCRGNGCLLDLLRVSTY